MDDISIIGTQQKVNSVASSSSQVEQATSNNVSGVQAAVVQSKAYKLDHNTPNFFPNDKLSIKDWFFSIENSMLVAGIPDSIKVPLSANYLKGTAFQIGKRHVIDKKSWGQLKAELIKTFTPVDEERKLRLQLITLRMSDSFSRFNDKFQSLVNQMPNLTEEAKLDLFMQGISDKLRVELTIKDVTSMHYNLQHRLTTLILQW